MNDVQPLPFMGVIRPHTGAVTGVRPALGNNSATTVFVECESGPTFVKAVPNRPGGRRASLLREEAINPFVVPISPALRWRAEDEQWVVLGFDVIDGRKADFAPGSDDLPEVVAILNRIANLRSPDVAADWAENRWDRYVPDGEARWLSGPDLLYTDIHPGNLLIGESASWAIDWSWPTRGAGWMAPALLAVQLISSGHPAEDAEGWARRCVAWRGGPSRAIDVFAAAEVRMRRAQADRFPEEEWLKAMVEAAEQWADYRGVAVEPLSEA